MYFKASISQWGWNCHVDRWPIQIQISHEIDRPSIQRTVILQFGGMHNELNGHFVLWPVAQIIGLSGIDFFRNNGDDDMTTTTIQRQPPPATGHRVTLFKSKQSIGHMGTSMKQNLFLGRPCKFISGSTMNSTNKHDGDNDYQSTG
jgi:hypothetical protein